MQSDAAVHRAPQPTWIVVDEETLHCCICLNRQQISFRDSNGRNGHISKIKTYSLTTSSSIMNRHLKEQHDVTINQDGAGGEGEPRPGSGQQSLLRYASGVAQMRPAATPYEVNRDLALWSALDLQPFDFVENDGMKFFFRKNFPSIKLPSSRTLAGQSLDDVYDIVKDAVTSELGGIMVICVMFDGWTDSHGFPFLGLRVGYITRDREYKIITLSCKLLKGHTAQILANHVKSELERFTGRENIATTGVRLFTTHDGAANMIKASSLLKSDQVVHCVAHALHLLLVNDGINRVCEIKTVLEKCGQIVHKLHFKGCELKEEVDNFKDISSLDEILDKIAEAVRSVDADESNPVNDNEYNDVDDSEGEGGVSSGTDQRKHQTLKKPVVTRWNSALHMISSVLDNVDAVDQVLLRSGLGELRLEKDEKELLVDLRKFLSPFEEYTQLVSQSSAFLSLIVLIRQDITQRASARSAVHEHTAVKDLKTQILKNVNRRLQVNDAVVFATVVDPSTKSYASSLLTDEQIKPYVDCITSASGSSSGKSVLNSQNDPFLYAPVTV